MLIVVKQGEEINVNITLRQSATVPLDLTGAEILVEVKLAPFITQDAIFSKTITESTDPEVVGQITDAVNGIFNIRFNEADTSLQNMDYALVLFLIKDNTKDIISSEACDGAIYRVCTQ